MNLTSPARAVEFFRKRLRLDIEEFWVAALGADKRVIMASCVFRGTVDQCLFHPRDVFRFAVLHNASSLIVAHGHPSGDPRPSEADGLVTEQILNVAALFEIPLLDHLIVTERRGFSFRAGRVFSLRARDPTCRGLDQY